MRRYSMPLRVLLFACLLGIALPGAVTPAGAVPDHPSVLAAKPHPQPSRAARAEEALDRVTELLNGLLAPAQPQTPGDLSLALRDLALLKDALSPAERQQADQLLARPTDNPNRCRDVRCYRAPAKSKCSDIICVHWVTKSQDSKNGVKSQRYVNHVLKTMTHVYSKYLAAGYPRVPSDRGRGGDNRPDVYLAQIGDYGYYGYCAPEGPRGVDHGKMWGYCVLDNNYSQQEFPAHTPLQNMKVTAAHEFFHDVQFGMDAGEDGWFMEATSTWVEDMVFDKINDNANYLPYGPIAHPEVPINTFNGLYQYGDWIFIRYLTDRYGDSSAGMDDLVLDMWKASAGKRAGRDSIRAITKTLAAAGTSLADELARFSAGNRRPELTYAAEVKEVAKQDIKYPRAPLAATVTLAPDTPVSKSKTYKHLTARTFRYVPSTTGSLALDFTFQAGTSGRAVIVVKQDGAEPTRHLVTTSGLQPPITVDSSTKWVEVTMADGSTSGRHTDGVTAKLTP